MKYALILAVVAGPVLAETCPPGEDFSVELDRLRAAANAAADEQAGKAVAAKMWAVWLRAPDATAQEVLDRGMRQLRNNDLAGAYDSFDRLVAYCPGYAEGHNQRAFVHYLRGDFEAALVGLDAALVLTPVHVGAQSGRALTLMQLGRTAEARTQLRAALVNNPWLSERFLLAKGGPLAPKGEDI